MSSPSPPPLTLQQAARGLKFNEAIIVSLTSAISLIIALYWKDFITNLIAKIVPTQQELFWNFIVTILLTVIGVSMIYILYKSLTIPPLKEIVYRWKEKEEGKQE